MVDFRIRCVRCIGYWIVFTVCLFAVTGCRGLTLTQAPYHHTKLSMPISGKEIYFSARINDHFQVFSYNFSKRTISQVTSEPADHYDPCISPDGNLLVVLSNPSVTNSDLFLLNLRDKTKRRLTTTSGEEMFPTFTPDGKEILFVRGARWRMTSMGGSHWTDRDYFRIDLAGEHEEKLTNENFSRATVCYESPDMTKAVFSTYDDDGKLFLIEFNEHYLIKQIPFNYKYPDSPFWIDSKGTILLSAVTSIERGYGCSLLEFNIENKNYRHLYDSKSIINYVIVDSDNVHMYFLELKYDDRAYRLKQYDALTKKVKEIHIDKNICIADY